MGWADVVCGKVFEFEYKHEYEYDDLSIRRHVVFLGDKIHGMGVEFQLL